MWFTRSKNSYDYALHLRVRTCVSGELVAYGLRTWLVVFQKIKGIRPRTSMQQRNEKRPEEVPYLHKVSHNLTKKRLRWGTVSLLSFYPWASSANSALVLLLIAKIGPLKKRHDKPFVEYAAGVVHKSLLGCGKSYIGQTERCLDDRLSEHAQNLKTNNGAHLTTHCKSCRKCEPRFYETEILNRSNNHTARELLEEHRIR